MTYRPKGTTLIPRCCDDADGGEMVRVAGGWLCVWCGRVAPREEQYRQLVPPGAASAAVRPTGIRSTGPR